MTITKLRAITGPARTGHIPTRRSVSFDFESFRKDLSNELRLIRIEKGITPLEVATALGVTRRTVYRFFAGGNEYQWMQRYIEICAAIGVDPSDMIKKHIDNYVFKY